MINNTALNPLYKQKSGSDDLSANTSKIYKILPAATLLDEEAIKYVIKDLSKQLAIPLQNFQEIYQETINRFAEFVQGLPNAEYQSFNFFKGHLLMALFRANIAINETGNYPCPVLTAQNNAVKIESRAAMWQYVIFSSSLLLDIGKTISSTSVQTCLEHGEQPWLWPGLDGSMMVDNNNNTHYYYTICNPLINSYNHILNLLFARIIIPDYIFTWIYSEPDIFFEWLSILNDQASGSGTLHKLNIVSVRKLINEYMGSHLPINILKLIPTHIKEQAEQYHKTSFWKGVEFSLRGKKNQSQQYEHNHGTEFLNWLREGLANKSIPVNQENAKVHISKEGVFLLNPEIFLEFSAQFPKYADWHAVFKYFIALGITRYVNSTNIFQYNFTDLNNIQSKRGLLIQDPSILFGNQPVPSISPEIAVQPLTPIVNSGIFPTPREEVGTYLRQRLNPAGKNDLS